MIESITGDKLILRCNHASKDFLSHISEYRRNELFTDMTLRAEDQTIRAHKIVLSACSPYFEKLFTQNFIENASTSITIEVCSGNSIRELVDYMYNGVLEIDKNNVEDLLKASDFLLLENTRSAILRYLQQTLNNENCIKALHLGRLYCCEPLISSAFRYLKCHYHSIYEEDPNFVNIPLEELKSLFIQHSSIFIRNDCETVPTLIESILKWNEFNHLPHDHLWSDVLQYLNYDKDSMRLLPSELQDKAKQDPQPCIPKAKRLNQLLIAVAFDEKEIEYLDLDNVEDGWNVLTDIPSMRYGLCGASMSVFKNKIYITGGVGSGGIMKPLKRFLIYDLESNTWSNGPDMNYSRRCHGSCIYKSDLYVFGGENEGNGATEVFNFERRKWISGAVVPPLEKIQSFSHLCPMESSILCLSNYGDGFHGEDWILDDNNNWSRFGSERLPRDHPGFGSDPQGLPLVIGGKQETNGYLSMTEVLLKDDTYGKRWTPIGELNKARASPGIASSSKNGTIYVVGGKGSEGTTEVLQNGNDKWEILPNINLGHSDQEYVAAILDR